MLLCYLRRDFLGSCLPPLIAPATLDRGFGITYLRLFALAVADGLDSSALHWRRERSGSAPPLISGTGLRRHSLRGVAGQFLFESHRVGQHRIQGPIKAKWSSQPGRDTLNASRISKRNTAVACIMNHQSPPTAPADWLKPSSAQPLNYLNRSCIPISRRTAHEAGLRIAVFLPLGGRPIGRTPDSDSGYPGSSPGLPAKLFARSKAR